MKRTRGVQQWKNVLNDAKAAPDGRQLTMYGLEAYIRRSSIEPTLRELVLMRASQINGCAYCLDMHSKDARANGETEQRLYGLNAWRETPYYSARERAALEWTEALTLISETHAPDEVYEETRAHFDEKELVDLTLTITTINAWIGSRRTGFRTVPGTYRRLTPQED